MSKHTPGPWNYDAGYIDTHAVDDDGSRDCVILAEMHSTFGPDDYGVHQWMLPPEEYEANGRLIAAAPEMYELLAEFRDTATIETPTDVLERVNTLLAKIEGGGDAAEYVTECCESLLRNTKLTKATVRPGEDEGASTWIFTLECEIRSIKRALTVAYIALQVERMRDGNVFYRELEIMARAVVQATVDAAVDKLVKLKGGRDAA